MVIDERASKPALAEDAGRLPSSLNQFDFLLEQFVDELSDLDATSLGRGGEVVLDIGVEVGGQAEPSALLEELAARALGEVDLRGP